MSEVALYHVSAHVTCRKPPCPYMGTSLTRNRTHLGPYRRPVPRVLGS